MFFNDVAVFPLAIPLISGPGAIATILVLSARAHTLVEHAVVYGSIVVIMSVVYVSLMAAHSISRFLGRIGMNVFTRLSGLLLAALAAQFVIDGILGAIPALTRH